MVRCTKYWDKIISLVQEGNKEAIEAFCMKDKLQAEYIVQHADFMQEFGDAFETVVIGIPDEAKDGTVTFAPAAESAFRNLRRAWLDGKTDIVENVLGILQGQITMLDADKRRPVTARQVNDVLRKVDGGKPYLTKSDAKNKRLTAIVSNADYSRIVKHAMTLYPKSEKESHAVASLMTQLVRELLADIKGANKAGA
jgi:hypothetical protein